MKRYYVRWGGGNYRKFHVVEKMQQESDFTVSYHGPFGSKKEANDFIEDITRERKSEIEFESFASVDRNRF